MKNRILFLNVKYTSINPEYLLSALRSRGWEISVLNAEYKPVYRYFALLASFHPNISKWKSNFDKKMNVYNKMPAAFINKSSYLANRIERHSAAYDIVFQSYCLYRHYTVAPKTPYVVFADWTRSLTIKKHPERAPIKSEKHVKDWLKLEGDLLRNASAVFTMSDLTRNSVITDYYVPADKVVTVGLSSMFEKIPKKNPNKDYSSKIILFVGYLFEWKGGFALLEAFKKVRKSIKDAKLVIITKEQLREKVEGDGILFLDSKVPRSEVLKQFEKASIFVMPSFCEPLGAVFLEAMAYQLPCIGTDVGGPPEIIENNKTGFIVPANNVDELSDKIATLLSNPSLMRQMGDAGYERFKSKFTWDKVAEKMDKRLRVVLS